MAEAAKTVKEVATELNLSQATIRLWMRQRKIAFVRLGRAVRIPASEIARFVAKGHVEASDSPAVTSASLSTAPAVGRDTALGRDVYVVQMGETHLTPLRVRHVQVTDNCVLVTVEQ